MKGNHKDLRGQIFNQLTVIDNLPNGKKLCRCTCGNLTEVKTGKLTGGHTKSCGCLLKNYQKYGLKEKDRIYKQNNPNWRERISKTLLSKHNYKYKSIGKKVNDLRLYNIWKGMKQRCYNSKFTEYHCYGGKGITICKEWLDFQNFYDWALNNGYNDKLTIDRIDNTQGYNPVNCRWATTEHQQENKTTTKYITFQGKTMCQARWAEHLGIKGNTLTGRLKKWSIDKALTLPNSQGKTIK